MVDSCCGGCLALGSHLENLSQNMMYAGSPGSLDTVGVFKFLFLNNKILENLLLTLLPYRFYYTQNRCLL